MNLFKNLTIQEINEEENNFCNKSIKYLHFLHKKTLLQSPPWYSLTSAKKGTPFLANLFKNL